RFLMVSVSLWTVSRSPALISGLRAISSSSSQSFSFSSYMYSMIFLLSCHTGNYQACVLEPDSLSADIFHADSCRLTTGDKDKGSNAHIKLVAEGGRSNGSSCISLRLSFNGNSD